VRRAPNPIHFLHFPTTAGTIILSVALSIAWWSGVDVSILLIDPLITRGQFQRLVSSALLHANLLHLLFNLWWIWYLGTLVEQRWGHARALVLFIYLALGSGAAEFALLDGSVGLSGIVYGLCGFLWWMSWKDKTLERVLDPQSIVMLLVCFVMGVILSVAGAVPVANIAHLSGALLGLLAGWTVSQLRRRPEMTLPPICAVSILLTLATFARPWINRSPSAGEEEAYRGYHALSLGKDDEALDYLRDATKAKPQAPTWWFNLAVAEHRAGNYARASAAYDRAAQLDPANHDYRTARDSMSTFLTTTAPTTRPS
jgi:GlpG protein